MGSVPYEFVQYGGYLGSQFTSVFFFENVFWRMALPIVYGERVPVNVLNCLVTMPEHIRGHVLQDDATCIAYRLHWADCIDYCQGMEAFFMQPPNHPAAQLVHAMDRDVRSTIADLAQEQPNSNAMHHARAATEKALKAYLCFDRGYTVNELRKQFNHDVGALAAEIFAGKPSPEFASIQPKVAVFPPYSKRYAELAYSRQELWEAYSCAQFAASSLVRTITGYDQRGAVIATLRR